MFIDHISTIFSNMASSFSDQLYDTASAGFFRSSKVKKKLDILKQQSQRYRDLTKRLHERKYQAMDSLFLGGDVLSEIIADGEVSADILDSYALAYPRLAETTSFQEAVQSMNDDQLVGFVSGIKGKLFEVQYTDYLNDGILPDGYVASLADSPVQEGWDISITGPDGEFVKYLQAKATDSLGYIRSAVNEYPDIDVVTTDEIYSHLIMTDISGNVINSGISLEDLDGVIAQGIDASTIDMDFSLPVLSLAMIAFTAFSKQDYDLYQKCSHFGTRAGKSYACILISRSAMVLTQSWLLGLAIGLVSRHFAAKGRKKSEMFFELRRIIDTNSKIINRLDNALS